MRQDSLQNKIYTLMESEQTRQKNLLFSARRPFSAQRARVHFRGQFQSRTKAFVYI
jgi:hypothetical protein